MSAKGNILVTAGPTHEPIDPVRYLANRSSGKLGICLAQAARDAGWEVTLLLGPTAICPPENVHTLRFETAEQLAGLLEEHFSRCDVLIMAAAVADFRPTRASSQKLPRTAQKLVLELEPTPDLVARCAASKRPGQRIIGFVLGERAGLESQAPEKLHRKGLDAVVANPPETMGADEIEATVYTAAGETIRPESAPDGRLSKADFARWLINWLSRPPP